MEADICLCPFYRFLENYAQNPDNASRSYLIRFTSLTAFFLYFVNQSYHANEQSEIIKMNYSKKVVLTMRGIGLCMPGISLQTPLSLSSQTWMHLNVIRHSQQTRTSRNVAIRLAVREFLCFVFINLFFYFFIIIIVLYPAACLHPDVSILVFLYMKSCCTSEL